jgi:hypothetical protein
VGGGGKGRKDEYVCMCVWGGVGGGRVMRNTLT